MLLVALFIVPAGLHPCELKTAIEGGYCDLCHSCFAFNPPNKENTVRAGKGQGGIADEPTDGVNKTIDSGTNVAANPCRTLVPSQGIDYSTRSR